MKTAILFAAALAAASTLASANEGITFSKPVTYTQPVTYAAGVTYLAPVTYAASTTTLEPVVLEGIVVTPKRTYSASEYRVHLLSKRSKSPHTTVVRHQRQRSEWNGVVGVLGKVFN